MFQLELAGKPVIKWLVIRIIETLHINGGSCSLSSNGHFQPRISPRCSIVNVQDGKGREQVRKGWVLKLLPLLHPSHMDSISKR